MSCGIYKVENLINHKVYIGKSIDVDNRWESHKANYNSNRKSEHDKVLYKAMRKYGLQNFSFEVLEFCEKEELSEKEKEYIKKYDCCLLDGVDKGYNMTRGGDGNLQKDYEQILELWNQGFLQKEICEYLNIAETTVIRVLNYYGISTKERHHRAGIASSTKRPVMRYDLNLNFIEEYPSIREASRKTGLPQHSISKACDHLQRVCGNSIWAYKGEKPVLVKEIKPTHVPIIQYTLDMHEIARYSSFAEASRALNLCAQSISDATTGKQKTCGGYIWRRQDNE